MHAESRSLRCGQPKPSKSGSAQNELRQIAISLQNTLIGTAFSSSAPMLKHFLVDRGSVEPAAKRERGAGTESERDRAHAHIGLSTHGTCKDTADPLLDSVLAELKESVLERLGTNAAV